MRRWTLMVGRALDVEVRCVWRDACTQAALSCMMASNFFYVILA
jgi:hypothetical protein